MNKQLLKPYFPLMHFLRCKVKYEGGIKYPGGIVYYPRYPENHKDPEYTPTKLFRVELVKKLKGQPYWLKKICSEFKIDQEHNHVAVVKNTPEINMMLWKIKHLIKVTPITFPYGEPKEEDIKYTILKENGECIVTKTLQPNENSVQALESYDNDIKKMDSYTIKRDSRKKWMDPFGGGF